MSGVQAQVLGQHDVDQWDGAVGIFTPLRTAGAEAENRAQLSFVASGTRLEFSVHEHFEVVRLQDRWVRPCLAELRDDFDGVCDCEAEGNGRVVKLDLTKSRYQRTPLQKCCERNGILPF